MPPVRLAIIADDLTGALDAAAPFAAVPGGVTVATRPEALATALAAGAAVVAVSTRSREIDAAEARRRVAGVLGTLPGKVRIVKKIDSRLKGNIAAELEAFGDRPLVVLPAIPDFDRVVRDGHLAGFGLERPLPVRPVLGRASYVHVPDVATQADLVREVGAAPEEAVLVGARGLALALAEAMALAPAPTLRSLPGPVCFAVGSTDPITFAQVGALREARTELAYVAGPAGTLPPPSGGEITAVTLLQAVSGAEGRPNQVAAAFARTAAPYLRAARSMLLTGGATAEAVLDALGREVLAVAGEALPGMACCRVGSQMLVTKSGGFGAPDALVRLVEPPARVGA